MHLFEGDPLGDRQEAAAFRFPDSTAKGRHCYLAIVRTARLANVPSVELEPDGPIVRALRIVNASLAHLRHATTPRGRGALPSIDRLQRSLGRTGLQDARDRDSFPSITLRPDFTPASRSRIVRVCPQPN